MCIRDSLIPLLLSPFLPYFSFSICQSIQGISSQFFLVPMFLIRREHYCKCNMGWSIWNKINNKQTLINDYTHIEKNIDLNIWNQSMQRRDETWLRAISQSLIPDTSRHPFQTFVHYSTGISSAQCEQDRTFSSEFRFGLSRFLSTHHPDILWTSAG